MRVLFADAAYAALSGAELADADELAPDGGKASCNQHDRGIVAEHAAHAAHVGAIGPELAVTGCVEDAGQDQQHHSSKIHRRSPLTGGVRLNDFVSLSFRRKIFSTRDTSGKSAAPRHHREDGTACTGNRRRGFFFTSTLARGV